MISIESSGRLLCSPMYVGCAQIRSWFQGIHRNALLDPVGILVGCVVHDLISAAERQRIAELLGPNALLCSGCISEINRSRRHGAPAGIVALHARRSGAAAVAA